LVGAVGSDAPCLGEVQREKLFGTGDWKVAGTRRQEMPGYISR
jgi:hypothetical protein